MTIRAFAFFSLVALAWAGCSGKTKCDSTSCTGCCVDSNTCVDGTTKAQCGASGEACQACSGICFMQKCSGSGGGAGGGAGGGGTTDGGSDGGVFDAGLVLPCPQSCAGCCINGVCYAGTDTGSCGKGGLDCTTCAASQSCTNDACTDTTCGGCVSGATCRSPVSNAYCGSGGASCFDCAASGGTCSGGVCTGEQCANGCLDSLGRCQNGELKGYCGHGGGACAACPVGQGCSDGGCITIGTGTLPPGDICGNVDSLFLSQPNATGTTRGYTNDTSGSCGGSAAPDHVYVLYVLNPVTNVDVTVAPTGSSYQPVVYARTTCDPPELGCTAAAGGGSPANLHFDSLSTSIYVYVDGLNGTSGDYTVTITYTP